MKPAVRTAYLAALRNAALAEEHGDLDAAFAALERAHILGQRFLLPHVTTHVRMFRIGLRRRDAREMFGQVVRMIATVPGWLLGWVPKGNTGGANVSALRPMPLPPDLHDLLHDFHVWRDVLRRVAIGAVLAGIAFAALVWADHARAREAAALEQAWSQRAPQLVADFGSTKSFEVIPLVNWRAPAGLRSEPGVSYLIRTDHHTILFDLGYNRANENVSPLEHNLAALGIDPQTIDAIFISHAHRDHLGGTQWERTASLGFGKRQPELGDTRIFAPVPLTYPGSRVETVAEARGLLPGVASTGPIARRLFLGRIDEQSLIIHVEGHGLVAIVGCGHQTVPKLLEHVRENFSQPLVGLIGDIHYPYPEGRLRIAGIDVQRRLASGDGLWRPIGRQRIQREIDQLESQLDFIALGTHDTSDAVLDFFATAFGSRFEAVVVGQPIAWPPHP